MVPLQHGGLQRRQVALRRGIVPGAQRLAQGQDVAGDGRIQLQRRIRVQIGRQGELQLLQLQFQRLDPADGLQSAVVAVHRGHRLAGGHPLSLLHSPGHGAGLAGQRLLRPHQPALHGDNVLRLCLIDQRDGHRVGKVVVYLRGEVHQHCRQHRDGQHLQQRRRALVAPRRDVRVVVWGVVHGLSSLYLFSYSASSHSVTFRAGAMVEMACL